MHIDREYAGASLQRLVQVNSINPTLAPGTPGDGKIAGFVAESLASVGLTVETFEPEPGGITVVGQLAGG